MMPSFNAINYSLRPSKTIQRKLVFSGVGILQNHLHLERMVYIGFGSIWFTDFTLAHKLLGIEDMVSIEGHDIGVQRARFNAPYATVRVEHGYSNNILPNLFSDAALRGRPWMVWLDYDYEFNESIHDDIRSLIENAPENSIVVITFNGIDRKYGQRPGDRPARLRNLLGSVVPDELSQEACKDELMQVTLANLSLDFMKSIAADLARPGGFVPAFRIMYRDTTPMVTVGGVLPAKGAAAVASDVVNKSGWPGKPLKSITAPHLTMREAATLQSQLPSNAKLSRGIVQGLGFDLEEEQIDAFETYYREYPAFAQIVT
jgi:hypothetical protein